MSGAALFYRALLRAYPGSFREEYGLEMSAVFRRRYAHARSPIRRLAVLLEATTDTCRNAPATHCDILRQDLRLAVRSLGRMPALSITVMLVAAVGIGATTAAFSLADHVLIRPLPFPQPDRLVKVWEDHSYRGYSRMEVSPPNYRDWKAAATSFEGLAAYTTVSAILVSAGEPLNLDGAVVLGDLFGVLGTRPILGRTITAEDEPEGAAAVVVISERLWHSRFNADPAIIGRTFVLTGGVLSDTPRTVVGVIPATFDFPSRRIDFWMPLQVGPEFFRERGNHLLEAVARLTPHVTIDQANAELNVVVQQLARQFSDVNQRSAARVIALRDELSQQSRMLLWGLVAASTAVLLIACANLASLFLTRGLARQHELAVRAALGAGRHRLLRQLFTEGALLAGGGGLAGVALAIVAVPSVARLVPTTLPIAETPNLDLRMLVAAAGATLAAALAFALLPAIRVGRLANAGALGHGARAGSSGRTERMRSMLVVAEIAASVVLLVSSGLLVRALLKVERIDPGFQAEGVLTLRTALPPTRYPSGERRQQFFDAVLPQVRALPGVSAAGYITFLPMVMRGGIWPVTEAGQPPDPASPRTASLRYITPGLVDAMRIPIRKGRDVSARDDIDAPFVALVSESFVKRQWPGQDPIGRHFTFGLRDRMVVGVVADIRVRGLERDSEPQVYLPAPQVPEGDLASYAPREMVIRSTVSPETLVASIRDIVKRVDPQLPVSDVRLLSDVVAADTAPRRVQVRVIGGFAAIAFLLAAIGLHGLLAFNVSSRARDIGVRMALGAERSTILGMVLRRGIGLSAAGVVIGGALALAAGRSMQALLAGISPVDGVTLAAAAGLCLVMTLAGCLVPALRAVRVDPLQVIRTE